MGNFFLFLIFYKYLIDKVLYLNKSSLSHKTSLNSVSKNQLLVLYLASSEIWNDKLIVLYNRYKERRRCSLQILDKYFGINALFINC